MKYIKLVCGDKVRYVKNLKLDAYKYLGCSGVDDGHDDIFDLGIGVDDLAEHGLLVEADDRPLDLK